MAVNGASNGGQGSAPEIFVEAGATVKVDSKPATTVLAALEADQDVEMEPASATPALKTKNGSSKTVIANAIQTKLQSAKVAAGPAAATAILSANSSCVTSPPMEGGSNSSSPDTSASSSPHKRTPSTNMLETMALWLPSYIQVWPPSQFYSCLLFV